MPTRWAPPSATWVWMKAGNAVRRSTRIAGPSRRPRRWPRQSPLARPPRSCSSPAELEPEARAAGVILAIEPLHPMYVADRAVVSTLGQALDIAEHLPSASGRIAGYQVCDFLTPLPADVLLARGMMGEGHVDFAAVTEAVMATGYSGDVEVEIFNAEIWAADPADVVERTVRAFAEHIPMPAVVA